jgi:VanZ family protein
MRLVSYGIQLYKIFLSDKRKFLYIPLGLYWLLIFILTSIPSQSMPKVLGGVDKLKHFGAYFVLAFLLNFTLLIQKKYSILSKKSILFTLLITTFYGLIDEVHQIFIPGRYFDWWDLVADIVGSLIGIGLVKIIMSTIREKDANLSKLS